MNRSISFSLIPLALVVASATASACDPKSCPPGGSCSHRHGERELVRAPRVPAVPAVPRVPGVHASATGADGTVSRVVVACDPKTKAKKQVVTVPGGAGGSCSPESAPACVPSPAPVQAPARRARVRELVDHLQAPPAPPAPAAPEPRLARALAAPAELALQAALAQAPLPPEAPEPPDHDHDHDEDAEEHEHEARERARELQELAREAQSRAREAQQQVREAQQEAREAEQEAREALEESLVRRHVEGSDAAIDAELRVHESLARALHGQQDLDHHSGALRRAVASAGGTKVPAQLRVQSREDRSELEKRVAEIERSARGGRGNSSSKSLEQRVAELERLLAGRSSEDEDGEDGEDGEETPKRLRLPHGARAYGFGDGGKWTSKDFMKMYAPKAFEHGYLRKDEDGKSWLFHGDKKVEVPKHGSWKLRTRDDGELELEPLEGVEGVEGLEGLEGLRGFENFDFEKLGGVRVWPFGKAEGKQAEERRQKTREKATEKGRAARTPEAHERTRKEDLDRLVREMRTEIESLRGEMQSLREELESSQTR